MAENNDAEKSQYTEKLVYDRFNFFLIATAFLITAFATLAIYYNTNNNVNCSLIVFSHLVSSVGFYLAFFFTFANYHGALLAKKQKEKDVQKFKPSNLISGLISDIFWRPWEPLKPDRVGLLHTWYIPVIFIVFWLIVWFMVLPYKWVPGVFGIIAPILYLMILIVFFDNQESQEDNKVDTESP